jgi:hypothetical protein
MENLTSISTISTSVTTSASTDKETSTAAESTPTESIFYYFSLKSGIHYQGLYQTRDFDSQH